MHGLCLILCIALVSFAVCNELQSLTSARQVLDLASSFIKERADSLNDPLPVVTISYAQTLDGSM